MKNSLNITAAGEDLLAYVNDGTNRLMINGTEIPSGSWTGAGTYTDTVQGHAISITKVEDLDGNVAIRKTAAYTYELYKIKKDSGGGGGGGEPNPPTLLWTNPDDSANFIAQTVSLSKDTASFDAFIVYIKYGAGGGAYHANLVYNNGASQTVFAARASTDSPTTLTQRDVSISGTSAVFTTGRYLQSNSQSNGDNYAIPKAIYGVQFSGATGPEGPAGQDGQDGQDGENGRGIVSIEKTATAGLVDIYTITYTDGTTSTFDVTNGRDGGASQTLLYTNSNTGANFSAQTIPLSETADSFDWLIAVCRAKTNKNMRVIMWMLPAGQSIIFSAPFDGSSEGFVGRTFNVSGTSVAISAAYAVGSGTTFNQFVIPEYIYGFKY